MALAAYKKKRAFDKTPEPTGGKPDGKQLHFVIQKHDASHLHYDFRLEMEGVLKSWAVPKGPSTDTSVKRLAMMVEDHPYDYKNFEGIIPKGQYGGGTVIVWDEGTYEAAEFDTKDKKAQEKHLLHQLHSGKVKIILQGKKLKGAYALVKSTNRGENAWLLMKLNDEYVSKEDITLKDKSVQSNKTIAQVEKTSTNIYGQTKKENVVVEKPVKEKKAPAKKKTTAKKTSAKKVITETIQPEEVAAEETPAAVKKVTVNKGKKEKFPADIEPMLTTLVDRPFDADGWLYEIKWDGYRSLAYLNKREVELRSRNNKSFNKKFYSIYNTLKEWTIDAVLDGEVIVANDEGISDFGKLQNWRSEADGDLKFYVFDVLWLDGYSLMNLTLTERREILKNLLPESNNIHLSQAFEASGTEFYAVAEKMGLEGIIAKKASSTYRAGIRSKEWLKIKTQSRQEVVIGGFTNNDGSSKLFSSLLVGVFEKGKLQYTGKIGTGFNEKTQREMMEQFKPLIAKQSPFTTEPDINKPSRFRSNPPQAKATWLQPKLVCEVSFREMTSDGVMRHPSFEGMRVDKSAEKVLLEKEEDAENILEEENAITKNRIIKSPAKKERKTLLNPTDETQERSINGHKLKFTNLSKIFWPDEKITKRELLNYYYQVAPYMLPYMKDRPQSLNRHPHGIKGQSFYQKDVTGKVPEWIETFPYKSDGDDEQKNFLVCSDEASLLYIASLGCIEMNPWSSRVQTPDNPDFCIIDLDPDKNSFNQVIEAANITKKVLDAADVACYCKTSGSTGLHIYIPLGAKYTYEASKEFARLIVKLVHKEIPGYTSLERMVANRKGKMYLDFLQNRPQATIATVYSARPKPGATVSTPLHWEEVKKGLAMKDFTIKNVVERIKAEGDIFKPVIGKGIAMAKAMKKMQAML